jgi:hypothetical protein
VEGPVTDKRLDDETLAAFLDGTLPAADRATVVHTLASNPQAYEEFLDAAAIAALVRDNSDVRVIPVRRPRGWQRSVMLAGPVLVAAGIAAIFVARSGRTTDTIDLMQRAQLASVSGAGSVDSSLGQNWDQPGWSVVRGSSASRPSAGVAARMGARVAQLEYVAYAADTVAWRRVSAALVDLVTSIEGAGPVGQQLRGAGIPLADDRASLARQLREISGESSAFNVGAWLETARLAAVSSRFEYFRSDGALASLSRIREAIQRDQPTWSVIIAHLRALENESDTTRVRQHVDSAMAAFPR